MGGEGRVKSLSSGGKGGGVEEVVGVGVRTHSWYIARVGVGGVRVHS